MSRWEHFCVVGIGAHARTKLIPAIEANGQTIVGVVSKQSAESLPDVPIFQTIDAAFAAVPQDTVFVLASPPSAHHAQAGAAIDAGFDVIVEKPAFVTAAEANDIAGRCAAKGTVLAEAFMQRHTDLYRRLLEFCAAHQVSALDLAFVIPAMPGGTFRSQSDLGSSSLYDIGCYILALLGDLRLDISALEIVGVQQAGTMAEVVDLAGALNGIAVTAKVGVGPEYRNRANVRLADGTETCFQPIFYGRPGRKTIGEEPIEDGNAFEAMFAVPREQRLLDQRERFASIVSVTVGLEALAAQLAGFRAKPA